MRNNYDGRFTDYYEKYFLRVHRYVARLLRFEIHAAEDITQEAFLRAYRDVGQFSNPIEFLKWVYTIARNLSFNYIRHKKSGLIEQKNRGYDSDRNEMKQETYSAKSDSASPDRRAVANELINIVNNELEKMPSEYSVAIRLCCFDGLSYKAAAAALNTTESVVAHNLMRARKKLQYFHN